MFNSFPNGDAVIKIWMPLKKKLLSLIIGVCKFLSTILWSEQQFSRVILGLDLVSVVP